MTSAPDVTTRLSTTVAVVVHYRSYDTVARTVANLLEQGLSASNVVLIDNSEQPELRADLESSIPADVSVQFTDNLGYAAAVNAGMEFISTNRLHPPEFLIVATHETVMRPLAVDLLVGALEEDPQSAVAGPTLISGEAGREFVWSTGGYLSKIAHIPSHFDHRGELSHGELSTRLPQTRAWLDGAFLAYRWSAIASERLSEEFFLYMEETDLHLRLGRKGLSVLWVPSSVVWQSSGGIPPYYLARNLRLLFRRNEPFWRRALVPLAVGKRVAADVLKRRDMSSIGPSIRGLTVRVATTDHKTALPFVSIVNPLGGALAHYQRELVDNLAAAGIEYEIQSTLEPSVGSKSKRQWVWDYWSLLRTAARFAHRRPHGRVLVVWPVLGYLDIVLLRFLRAPTSLIIHDPRPLVNAIGYDRFSRSLAWLFRGRTEIIVHSEQAAAVVRHEAPSFPLMKLAHPILEPVARGHLTSDLPIVQVFGQFKPDRDLDALASIAGGLSGEAHFAIDGRGWPEVQGWTVTNRFVPENEVDDLILQSAVVVIPYRHFFQSGVAIRALESSVPFVGPRHSSLSELVTWESPLLADEVAGNTWSLAVRAAIASGAEGAGVALRIQGIATWRSWARQ